MSLSVLLRVALAIVLTLIIAVVIRSYTAHRSNAHSLLKAVDTLKQDNPTLHLMDSALLVLSEAENNFRLYTATYQRGHLQTFSSQMNTVSTLLDSAGRQPMHTTRSSQLELLVKRKSEMADKIARLKLTTDSMLERSLKDDMINRMLRSIPPYRANKIRSQAVSRDTLRSESAPAGKKGLFKRLGQAIANKKDTVSSQSIVVVRTKDGQTMSEEDFEAHQLRKTLDDVNKHYKGVLRAQLEGRKQINTAEHSLAGTSLDLLNDLKGVIQSTTYQMRLDQAANKASADRIVKSNIDKMALYMVLFLIGTVLLIVLLLAAWNSNRQYSRQLKQEKEKALETARARAVFMTNMSHEIRTPLNSIVGFSEQLEHTALTPQQKDMVRAIDVSSDMLMAVVNDVLDFSKLENDYIIIQKKPFQLYEAIHEVTNTMRIQATNKQLGFQLKFDGDQRQLVLGDEFRLQQILINLIGNAIKYTEKGNITVMATLTQKPNKQGLLTMAVQDTGPGIRPDLLPRIFERYYQTRSARLTSKGTGLGLAITRKLVELHGGEIKVESEQGKGSVFTCILPFELVSEPQLANPVQKVETNEPVNSVAGLRVLVADDQEMNLLLLKVLLTRWNCKFDLAADGQQAIDLFESKPYDLVLLDLQMPILSGIDVVERIRASQEPEKASVVVLALTADITPEDEELFRKAGFDDWVLKPFREKDLQAVIVKKLASRTEAQPLT